MDVLIVALIFASITGLILIRIDKHKDKKQKTANKNFTKTNNGIVLIDYTKYHLSLDKYILYILASGISLFIIGYIFYQQIIIALFLSIFSLFYPYFKKRDLKKKRDNQFLIQFKQALYSISTSLVAGRSIENAFNEVINDLKLLYPSQDTYIIKEFEIIIRRIENGETIEKALKDLSERVQLEDITNFADVFITAKRTGGDLVEVIRKTSNIIGEKIEIQQEINVLIAQKKFEAKILSISPFILIGLLSYSASDYMEPLYNTGNGLLIMTISLILLVFAYWLINKIMDIKV